MKKVLKLVGGLFKGIGKGGVKVLPFSGIVTAYKEVRESKWEFEKVVKLASYVLVGLGLWALIIGKLTIDDLIAFIKALNI